jgi:predicted PurR-regulated permease PerM
MSHKQLSGSSVLISAAAFVVIVAGMRAAESILVPFLIAIFIAVICMPSLSWLQKKSIPAALAILIIVVGILLIGTFLSAKTKGPDPAGLDSVAPYCQQSCFTG